MKRYQDLRKGLGLMVMVMGVILGLGANLAVANTGNILLNPGAESGMNNWNKHYGNFTTTGSYGPHSGNRLFYGGDNCDDSSASQYVDVSGYAKAIDDGQVWASFDSWFKSAGDDDGIFEMMFRTSGNDELQYYHSGWRCHSNWGHYAAEFDNKKLPNSTRKVENQNAVE